MICVNERVKVNAVSFFLLLIFNVNNVFALPSAPNLKNAILVCVFSEKGNFTLALDQKQAPITVKNFLRYVDEGFYEDTIFHRVISNFMIQGGGMTPGMYKKDTYPGIKNESKNGLSNKRGSVAMARTLEPNSATSQFYINVKDNVHLDATDIEYGYTVFAYVVNGMDVVDRISKVATGRREGYADVPVETIRILSIKRVKSLEACVPEKAN